jgi:hypothetical protein
MRRTILLAGALPFVAAFFGGALAFSLLVPSLVEAQEARIRAENVTVVDGSGTSRAIMSTGPGARSAVNVQSVEGAPRVSMNTGGNVAEGGTEPDLAGLWIYTPEAPGTPGFGTVARLTSQTSGTVLLGLGRAPGGISLQADAGDIPSRMAMRDADGNIRISLRVDPDGTPRIVMLDADGNVTWSAR